MATAWDWATAPRPNVALLKSSFWPKRGPGALPAVEVFDYLVGRTSNRHVLDVTLLASLHYADDTEAARIGRRVYSYGRFAIAETAYTRAVAIRGQQELRGPCKDNLGRVSRAQGRLDEAEKLHREVLEHRRGRHLVPYHSDILNSQMYLLSLSVAEATTRRR